MAIRVRSDGTTTTVDNVSAKGITIVKKVTVGRPVRKVNAAVVSVDWYTVWSVYVGNISK